MVTPRSARAYLRGFATLAPALAVLALSAAGCSSFPSVRAPRPAIDAPMPWRARVEVETDGRTGTPAEPVARAGLRAVPVEPAALAREVAGVLSGPVFAVAQAAGEGAAGKPELAVRLRRLRAELRFAGPDWPWWFAIAYDTNVLPIFIPDEKYVAEASWLLEVEATASGTVVFSQELTAGFQVWLSDLERGFNPWSHARLPDCLGGEDWNRLLEGAAPPLRGLVIARTVEALAGDFAARTDDADFLEALKAPERVAPDIAIVSPAAGAHLVTSTVTVTGSVRSAAPLDAASLEVYVDGRAVTVGQRAGTVQVLKRNIGGVSGSRIGGEGDGEVAGGSQADKTKPGVYTEHYSFELPVPVGAGEHLVEIVVSDRTGLTGRASVRFSSERPAGKVYVLAVGVEDYEDPAIADLRWTEDAAAAVVVFYREHGASPAQAADVKVLAGEAATKRAILLELSRHLERQAVHEEDVVVFFFAGHGGVGTHPTLGTEYFLYPQDAVAADLAVTGIETTELQRRWSAIRAGTKVFIADACHSAGVGVRAAAEGAERVGAGSVRFSAARASETSLELSDLEHGLFTHWLLEGLRGAADGALGAPPDGRVAVEELKAYLDREVPAHAARLGGMQTPVTLVETYGNVYLTKPAGGE